MAVRDKFLDLGNYISRRLSTTLVRPVSLPLIYQARVADSFIYESGHMLNMAFAYCFNNKIVGDYAEFGVFRGHTTIEAFRCCERYALSDTRLWLFDSFQGLPEVSGEDAGGPFVTGEFSFGRAAFEANLAKNNVDPRRIDIHEGYFDKTLSGLTTDRKFAVVWIDCDLYESTVPVLEWLTDKLVDGAVICFDDWFTFSGRADKGEQKATTEWLAANPNIRLMQYRDFHWGGRAFLAHLGDAAER